MALSESKDDLQMFYSPFDEEMKNKTLHQQSFGVGLRPSHFFEVLKNPTQVDFYEILTENIMDSKGRPYEVAIELSQKMPITLHGVSMSIGSCQKPNQRYLRQLKQLIKLIQPKFISDHICFTGLEHNTHDLLPLPYNHQSLNQILKNLDIVQNFLGQAIILENVSSYVQYKDSTMTEHEFLSELCRLSQCQLLLDVNNVYVSSFNHGFDPHAYMQAFEPKMIAQYHVAGFTHHGDHIIDTHSNPIDENVLKLYDHCIKLFGTRPTLLEWDDNIPSFKTLLDELHQLQSIIKLHELKIA